MVSHQWKGINTRQRDTDRSNPSGLDSRQQMLLAESHSLTHTALCVASEASLQGFPCAPMRRGPPGELTPAETEKQGKGPADTQAQLFVSEETSTCKEVAEGRNDREIPVSQGEIVAGALRDGWPRDVCTLLVCSGKTD